jgi:hypothetical protein
MLPRCNRQPAGLRTPTSRAGRTLLSFIVGGLAFAPWPCLVSAQEPAAKFLQSLKDSGYYDEALKYLELSAQRNRLPESMKADLGLEKIMLLQMSLAEVRTSKDLDEKLAQVEQGFKDFLTNSPTHPRRGETLLKLADLYLNRGTK